MTLSLLGSTGSIGTQTLDVARLRGYKVAVLTANTDVDTMEAQIREFSPRLAVMADEAAAKSLRLRVADTATRVEGGKDAVCLAASEPTDIVLNAIVGIAGLLPTLACLHAGNRLALANKETLVAGGELVMKTAAERGIDILPVDSEHSAIFQCLQGSDRASLKTILLTASGGPFFGKTRDELARITPETALRHPNWNMGPKVTVDSSTLMNKGLEFLEAMWLFHVSPEQIRVVIHRQSIVHSMVEFCDNAIIAQLGAPDMRIPIQYALTYPARLPSPVRSLSLADLHTLTFDEPDTETFRCLPICIGAAKEGGLKPCAANAANEVAVDAFLHGKIGWLDIPDLVAAAVDAQSASTPVTADNILAADLAAREIARHFLMR